MHIECPLLTRNWHGFEFRGAEGGVSSAPDPTSRRATVKMSDPSAPSELEKRSTEMTASTPPQILGVATCTRLRHCWCIRCHWCFRELGAADRMGGRCRDCGAVVRRAGLAMAAFAGAGPRSGTGRRGTSILAAGGWSNCCLGHASAEDWTELRASTRGQRFGAVYGNGQRGLRILTRSRHS